METVILESVGKSNRVIGKQPRQNMLDTVTHKSGGNRVIGKEPRQNILAKVIQKSVGKSNLVIGKQPRQN
jgi:hypothetical protein